MSECCSVLLLRVEGLEPLVCYCPSLVVATLRGKHQDGGGVLVGFVLEGSNAARDRVKREAFHPDKQPFAADRCMR